MAIIIIIIILLYITVSFEMRAKRAVNFISLKFWSVRKRMFEVVINSAQVKQKIICVLQLLYIHY